MIMKLTLKHVAPYLPYGLKTVHGLIRKQITAVSLDSPFVFCTTYLGSRQKQMVHIEEIKPILRPLSGLTLEDCMAYDLSNVTSVLCGQSSEYILKHTSYSDIETLISLHFDVFGLIPNGLAIDINTLES